MSPTNRHACHPEYCYSSVYHIIHKRNVFLVVYLTKSMLVKICNIKYLYYGGGKVHPSTPLPLQFCKASYKKVSYWPPRKHDIMLLTAPVLKRERDQAPL